MDTATTFTDLGSIALDVIEGRYALELELVVWGVMFLHLAYTSITTSHFAAKLLYALLLTAPLYVSYFFMPSPVLFGSLGLLLWHLTANKRIRDPYRI